MAAPPRDPSMPFLEEALSVDGANRVFAALSQQIGTVVASRLIRHKPGRRCVIEYNVESARGQGTVTLIGKARAKGLDRKTFAIVRELHLGEFGPSACDGIMLPAPVAEVPAFNMWLQEKVPGTSVAELLTEAHAATAAQRVAAAAAKLHRSTVHPRKSHTIADELKILDERLERAAEAKPEWRARISEVLRRCHMLAQALPTSVAQPIHRDFHPGQVIVDEERTWLLDFDLFAVGDPAVDVGNFAGHIVEMKIRGTTEASVMDAAESKLVDQYCAVAGERLRSRIAAYTTLTLARHISISMQFEDRKPITGAILADVESRLAGY